MEDPTPARERDLHVDGAALVRLARALAGDEAEDLVQDAYVVGLEGAREDVVDRASWLRGVVRRLARASARRSARRRERERRAARPEAISSPSPDDVERSSTAELLRTLVGELPEHQRVVVQSYFWSGRTTSEIAADLGRSHSTVRSQLKRGLDGLRAQLDERYGNRHQWSVVLLAAFGDAQRSVTRSTGAAAIGLSAGLAWLARRHVAALLVLGGAGLVLFGALRRLDPPQPEEIALVEAVDGAALLPQPASDPLAMPAAQPAPRSASADALSSAPPTAAATSAGELAPPAARAPARIEVTVRDATGATVAGAEVFVLRSGGAQYSKGMRSKGWTDADGRLAWDLAADELGGLVAPYSPDRVGVCARKPGLIRSQGHDVDCPPGATTSIEIALGGPAVRLMGAVVDVHGAPVVARVELGTRETRPDPRLSRPGQRVKDIPFEITTDAQGRFDETSLPAGSHRIRADARGLAGVEQWVDLREHEDNEVVLRLGEAAIVGGTVVDPDGELLAGAEIVMWFGGRAVHTLTGDDGSFSIPLAEPGQAYLTAEARELPGLAARVSHVLTPGVPFVWNAELAPVDGAWVQVMGQDGSPLAGWFVALHSGSRLIMGTLETNEQGFAGRHALPTSSLTAVVFGPDRETLFPLATRKIHEQAEPWPIYVSDAKRGHATLTGCLVSADGLAGLDVSLTDIVSEHFAGYRCDPASGCFEATHLPPALYALAVESPAGGRHVFGVWAPGPGARLDLGRLEVPSVGRVVIDLGQDAAGLRLGHRLWHLFPYQKAYVTKDFLAASGPPPREIALYPGLYVLDLPADDGRAIPSRAFRVQQGQTTTIRPLERPDTLIQFFDTAARPGERLGVRIFAGDPAEPEHDAVLEAVTPGVFELRAELAAGAHRFETRLGANEVESRTLQLEAPARRPFLRLDAD